MTPPKRNAGNPEKSPSPRQPPMKMAAESWELNGSLLNRLAASSGLVDPLCSRSEWLFAYHEAFSPRRALFLKSTEDSVLALAGTHHPAVGPLLEPLESHWFFPCPILGPDAVDLLVLTLEEPQHKVLRPCLAISGVSLNAPSVKRMLKLMGGRYEVGGLDPIVFRSASLEGGPDGFLSRRSAKFRSNLRKAVKKAAEAGIQVERVLPASDAEADAAYQRMIALESQSWKGIQQCGISQEPFCTFYGKVFQKMCRNGVGRAMFARHDGVDIGFVMGGIDGRHYRGQQFSYSAVWAPYSLGNLLQWEQIQWLCEEGIQRYDMGSVLEYKLHWTEIETKSHTLIWRPIC